MKVIDPATRETAVRELWPPLLSRWLGSPRSWLWFACCGLEIYAWVQFLNDSTAWSTVIVWLAGLAGFLVLLADRRWLPANVPISEIVLGLIVLGVGCGLRLYHATDIPLGLNNDAAYSGLMATNITRVGHFMPWSLDPTQGEPLFDYIVAGMQLLFGPGLTAVRGAATLVGIATLGAMYLLARCQFGNRMALIATFLLGTCGWHLIFSRVGWRAVTTPLFEAAALAFFFRALNTRRRLDFAIAGMLFALCLDTYPAGRIVFVVGGLWALVELAHGPRRLQLLAGYGILAISFIFGGAQVLSFAHLHPDLWGARSNDVSSLTRIFGGDWAFIAQQLRTTLGVFTVRANGSDFFIDQPLLDEPTSALFLIGLPLTLVYTFVRSYRFAFLLLGLVMGMIPAFVSDPNGNRSVAALIFVVFVAAVPLVAILDAGEQLSADGPSVRRLLDGAVVVNGLVRKRLTPVAPWVARVVVVIVLACAFVNTFNIYLGPSRAPMWGFSKTAAIAASYIRRIDAKFRVRVTNSDAFGSAALSYLTYSTSDPLFDLTPGRQWASPHFWFKDGPTLPIPDVQPQDGKGLAFIIPPSDFPTTREVLRLYPRSTSFVLQYSDGLEVGAAAAWVVLVPAPGEAVRDYVSGPPLVL